MKKRITRRIWLAAAGSTVAIAATFLVAAPAYATSYFTFENVRSSWCLGIDVSNGYIQQQACSYGGSQKWHETSAGQLENNDPNSAQKCLSIKDSSTATNAQLTGYTCKSSSDRPDQYGWVWLPESSGSDEGWLTNIEYTPGLTAGASGASEDQGADIINANSGNTNYPAADLWYMISD
jgi:hypothetical protein